MREPPGWIVWTLILGSNSVVSQGHIHILGAHGQLGCALRATHPVFSGSVSNGETVVTSYSRADCNLADLHVFTGNSALSVDSGDIVINCAAYTAVDAAEHDDAMAYRINAEAPGELAVLCRQRGAHLIHISTDYVFGGEPRRDENGMPLPWGVSDPVSPQCVYGVSKAAGEDVIRKVWQDVQQEGKGTQPAVIVRTSWLFTGPQRSQWGIGGGDFVTTMRRLYREKKHLTVVDDQYGCPTYSCDLARGIWEICHKLRQGVTIPGLLHASNAGATTWYEFATAIITGSGGSTMDVSPCRSSDFPTAAVRPAWSVLSPTSWNNAGLMPFRSWREALAESLQEPPTHFPDGVSVRVNTPI